MMSQPRQGATLLMLSLGLLLVAGKATGDGYIASVELLGKPYDVYRLPSPGGIGPNIKALNNRVGYDAGFNEIDYVATAVGDHAGDAITYSPSSGTSYLIPSNQRRVGEYSRAEDISDAGVVIGWRHEQDLGLPPRAFIFDNTNGLRYLDTLFPSVKALGEALHPPVTGYAYGAKGLRINRDGLMVIDSVPHAGGTTLYMVTSGGAVTPLSMSECQRLDLNNFGQLPPPGASGAGGCANINVVISDNGVFAGGTPGINGVATLNGSPIPNSLNTGVTSINNSSYVAAGPDTIFSPDGTRTDLRAELRRQLGLNHLHADLWATDAGSSATFINDAGDISWASLFFTPACPSLSFSLSSTGIEFINGKLSIRVGNRYRVTARATNGGRGPIRNLTVERTPGPNLFRVVSGPTPALPTLLEPGQTAEWVTELVAIGRGPYSGISTVRGESDCGPKETSVNLVPIQFIEPIVSVEFTVLPRTNTPAPDVFFVGADFDVIATVRNLVNVNLLNVVPVSPPTNVVAGVTKALSNADPATPQTIPPNGTATFQWVLRAARPGEATIDTAFTGTHQGTAFRSGATAPPILTVIPPVDLLLKRENEPTNAFAANNVYETMLDGRQYRFVAHAMRDTNRFNVRIENDSSEPESFVLRAIAPSAENWQIVYRHGATDITASVFSAGGWQTPELAPGAHTDVLLQLHDIAGDHGDRVRVRTEVSSVEDPEPIDAVIVALGIAEVPVETELQRVTASGYTAPSITNGLMDVDAPLELVTSKNVLATQPVIFGGWVADGVTPMLLKLSAKEEALEPFPEGRQFRVDVEIKNGGTIEGVALPDRFKLLKNGNWTPTNEFVLSPSAPAMFATFTPIAADELLLSSGKELVIGLSVVDIVSGDIVSEASLRLRKPPVVLIHGYNTPGDWGDGFILQIGKSRPLNDDRWVLTAKYGIGEVSGAYVAQMVNTLYRLEELVPLAELAFEEMVGPLHDNWAFTRFDAVCHSQGGLLTRMLCSENASSALVRPFRNPRNHFRGRFHRVVTLGSPHNGTRLLRYLIALDESKFSLLKNNLPALIGKAGVFSEMAQAKFDPFGIQIRDLNNPSPNSRWKPDPAAKFHLVRSTINLGLPPYVEDWTPSYRALGLFHPVAGPAVLPRGSDGVVDFDSMGAHGPNQGIGANVFTLTASLFVSHSPPLDAFGADEGQTASSTVGAHVIAALDQDPNTPASERVFSSFVVPELLDDSIRQQIDHWANVSIFEFLDSAINPPPPAPFGARSIVTTNLDFVLTTPTNRPVTGVVFWSVESFTTNGVNSDDIELTVNPADSRRVIVQVPTDLIGDVVLFAHYLSTNGAVVLIKPRRIYSTAPTNAVLVGIEIAPNNVPLPINSEVPIQIWTRYSNGHSILRYVEAPEVTAVSSAPNVVATTKTIAWRMVGDGTATIVANYLGQSATNSLSVYTPIPADAPTLSASWQPGQVILRWPASATNYLLESRSTLSVGGVWQDLTDVPVVIGEDTVVTNATTGSERYYRLRKF